MTDGEPRGGKSPEWSDSDHPQSTSQIHTDLERSYPICGAQKRQGEGVCTRPAGWGTDHAGYGSCKLHGGSKPIKSGRYSKTKRERIRELSSNNSRRTRTRST